MDTAGIRRCGTSSVRGLSARNAGSAGTEAYRMVKRRQRHAATGEEEPRESRGRRVTDRETKENSETRLSVVPEIGR